MPDQRDIAQSKKAIEQNKEEGTVSEEVGENPEHAVQPGKKTPQEHIDKDAIDESGNLIYEEDENDEE